MPVDCPAVRYRLRASRLYRIWIIAATDKASLADAFQVVPTISSLSPFISTTGVGDLPLTGSGGNFVGSGTGAEGSGVRWNGEALATTFVSATRLTAIVPAAELTTAGTAEVTVTNVSAGATSAPSIFKIDTTKPTTSGFKVSFKAGAYKW